MKQINYDGAILDIRMVMDFDKFKGICNNGNVSNSSFTKTKTRNGSEMINWESEDSNSGDKISMLLKFNSNRNEVTAEPFELQSRNFVTGVLHQSFIETLELLTYECNGDLSAYDNELYAYLVHEGKKLKADFGIVREDSKGKVNLEEDEDDGITNYRVNVSIKEYLTSNPDIAAELKALGCNSFEEKLNALGKKLIQLKLEEKINYNLFTDLFRQCGLLGATDPTVKRFYKLLT